MKMIGLIFAIILVSCKETVKNDGADTSVVSAEIQESELEVYDFEGLQKYLMTSSDTTFVINFWATWCAPCIKELPYFERLNSSYSDEKDEVILVSLDFPKKYESHLKPFIKEKKLKSKVVALNDPNSNTWIKRISMDWTGAIPATLIFNKDKRHFYEKTFTFNELETEVKQFLK